MSYKTITSNPKYSPLSPQPQFLQFSQPTRYLRSTLHNPLNVSTPVSQKTIQFGPLDHSAKAHIRMSPQKVRTSNPVPFLFKKSNIPETKPYKPIGSTYSEQNGETKTKLFGRTASVINSVTSAPKDCRHTSFNQSSLASGENTRPPVQKVTNTKQDINLYLQKIQ